VALVLTVVASSSPAAPPRGDRALPGCCGVNVRIPAAGDLNLTVVRFRGRRLPRPALTNLRRLPSGALVVAARRPLANGRSEVWLGVVNRAQTSARALSAVADDTAVKFRVTGGRTLRRSATIALTHLSAWPARPPAVCSGITNLTISGPSSPRPVQAWDARTDSPVEAASLLATWTDYVRAACDIPLDPARAEKWGIPHGRFTITLKPPSSIVVTGSVSNDSTGFVLKQLPATVLFVKRNGCGSRSRDSEHLIECSGDVAARQTIEFEVVFDRPVDRSSFALDPALGVTVGSVLYGPYSVAFG
jgi:hypothetical protein